MNKETIRLSFDTDKFEEITEKEFNKLLFVGEFCVFCNESDDYLYYKPKIKKQFPKVFKCKFYDFELDNYGGIIVRRKNFDDLYIIQTKSLNQLYKAVEESKRIRNGRGDPVSQPRGIK